MDDGRLRVMQLAPIFSGGVTSVVKELCKGLVRSGCEVMLACNQAHDIGRLREHGVRIRDVAWTMNTRWILRAARTVRRAIREFRPDVVHVHGREPGLVCHLAGRRPDWFTLHNTELTAKATWFDFGPVRKHLSPTARRCFVLNEDAAAYVETALGFSRDRVRIVPNGVDCERFRPPSSEEREDARESFGVGPGQTLALFVGRFHPQKQPLLVVDLARAAMEAGMREVRFVMVGAGELERDVRDGIGESSVSATCRVVGWSDPLRAYWAADLLIAPSLYEGVSMVVCEACATGCPILQTRTGGFVLTVKQGYNGFGCDTTAADFVRAGLEALRDPARLASMRDNAREWALSNLSSEVQVKRTLAAYRDALGLETG